MTLSLNVHRTLGTTLMHFPKVISQWSCVPGSPHCLLSASSGKTWGSGGLAVQDRVSRVLFCPAKGWTHLPKRGLLCGVGPLVSQNQGLLRLPDSPDNSLLWFLPSMFQYQISIERDLGVMKICTAKVFIQGSLLDTFIGLPSSMARPWFWNLALPFINQMTLAKSFNLFEL